MTDLLPKVGWDRNGLEKVIGDCVADCRQDSISAPGCQEIEATDQQVLSWIRERLSDEEMTAKTKLLAS